MTIPILGQTQNGVCVLCKGALTADHEHTYVDKKQILQMENVFKALLQMIEYGCIIPTDEGLVTGHPLLMEGYVWYPARITHAAPHDNCVLTFPHHHCMEDTDVRSESEHRP